MGADKDVLQASGAAATPIRGRLDVDVGALVKKGETIYRIKDVIDFETVIGIAVETGRLSPLLIRELEAVSEWQQYPTASLVDANAVSAADLKILEKRLDAIRPFLSTNAGGREALKARASQVGVHVATLYRWLKAYSAFQAPAMLIPQKRGWTAGNSRIRPEKEQIVKTAIDEIYLVPQRPRKQKVVKEVRTKCEQLGIHPPSGATIRARIDAVSEQEQLRRRGFVERAKKKFEPVPGKFPGADFPLAVVQIDHTPADVMLVDDVYRRPIGRPWITLAIDVYSRMVTGYYLSFDAPSVTSVAMCIAHTILPKEDWLAAHNCDATWQVWGFPTKLHFDNGPDFRSDDIRDSALLHNIQIEFRKKKVPRYGGHIERLLGTFAGRIHDELPGTTFSSVKDREEYDPEKHAALTKSEFEEWLVGLICNVYHKDMHSQLGMSPSRKWEIGIFGNGNDVKGIGMPARPVDGRTVQIDFLPSFRRTVQPTGVEIDGLSYYSEALRPFINAKDLATGKKEKFIFRRDPRDLSVVWFFDPILRQYFQTPLADQTLPTMSIWEYKEAKAKLKEEGVKDHNPAAIARALYELREQVKEAAEKTKRARRQAQRRKEHEKKVTPATPRGAAVAPPSPPQSVLADIPDEEIDAFSGVS